MATNKEQLDAVFNGLYDANATPAKLKKLVDAVIESLTPEQIEAKYPGVAAADLNDNQIAWFVLDALKADVRNRVTRNAERKNMQAQQEARRAARQAVQDAAAGL